MKRMVSGILCSAAIGVASTVPGGASAEDSVERVNLGNFSRAETHRFFQAGAAMSSIGVFHHDRDLLDLDNQTVIRSNRDTLYSNVVLDLTEPATITMPEGDGRFQSFLVINEDHFVKATEYGPGTLELTQDFVGTRYAIVIVRTFVNPEDPEDLGRANTMQDGIVLDQAAPGVLDLPNWDKEAIEDIRTKLAALVPYNDNLNGRYGDEDEVDPVSHLVGLGGGWGGNPPEEAIYFLRFPENAKADDALTLTLNDVPVDGFWSISMYDQAGFFVENPYGSYSYNNATAEPEEDGSVIIHFGGDPESKNYLHLPGDGWTWVMRLYRPHEEVVSGAWQLPELQPAAE